MELDSDVYTKGNHLCDEISMVYGLKTLQTDKDCLVCLEPNIEWTSFILPCGHALHTRCYAAYCNTQTVFSCPVCREFDLTDKNIYYCACCHKRGHPMDGGSLRCPYIAELDTFGMFLNPILDAKYQKLNKPPGLVDLKKDKRGIPCKSVKCKGYLIYNDYDTCYRCSHKSCKITDTI